MHYADCLLQTCDWDELFETPEGAVICTTLHMVVKHPDQYYDMTGTHPEDAKKKYADELKFFERKI